MYIDPIFNWAPTDILNINMGVREGVNSRNGAQLAGLKWCKISFVNSKGNARWGRA